MIELVLTAHPEGKDPTISAGLVWQDYLSLWFSLLYDSSGARVHNDSFDRLGGAHFDSEKVQGGVVT